MKRLRINYAIRVPTVRLIGENGEQLGIMAVEKAMFIAKEQGLDLAEIVPNSNPPVCKLLDYGKYQYHQKKIETKQKKQQKRTEIKGIRLGFKIGQHDLEVKIKQARKFLEDGSSVKVTLIFRGREAMFKNLAIEKMRKFYEGVQDVCRVDTEPKGQGNSLIMILTPNK